jgi:PAS domain S-box-containing protein
MEKNIAQASKHSAASVTLTQKISLLLLMPLFGALVSIAFFVGFMEETKSDGLLVNMAGQQRMLSVELREWAHRVAMGQEEDRPVLQARIAQFEKSLPAMERGAEVMNGLLIRAPSELAGELAAVDKLWRTLKPDLIDVTVRPRGEPQFQEAYRRVESGADELQKLSHRLVTRIEERTQSLRRRMLCTLGVIACLMGAIFLAGIFLARRYIVQPILRLDEAARRIGGGDFSQRLQTTTRDELSSVSHTFNQMAAETEQLLNALNLRRRYAETIIASVPAGLLVLRDDLAVLSANGSFRETFGVDEQAIARHPMVTEILPVSGLKEAALELLSTGEEKRNLPMEMPAKDGSRRLLRITLSGTRLAEEEEEEEARLLVIVEDVTEEEALRAAALESERRFRDLVQGLDAIVWEGEASGQELRFTFASRRAETIFGYPVERLLADSDFWKDRIHPDDRDRVSGLFRRIFERGSGAHGQGAAWEIEFRVQAADGRMVWLHNRARQAADSPGMRLRGVMTDITSRKLSEQALMDSEQRYAALFDAAPVPMWVYDIVTTRFLAVNHAAIQAYGYSAAEMLSMTIFDIRPQAEHERLRQQLAESAPVHRNTWQHRRKDGSLFSVDVVSQSIQYAGHAARFVVALDMTAQVKAEKEVQEHLFTLQRAADAATAIAWHQTLEGSMQEIAEQARGVIGAHQAVVSLSGDGSHLHTTHALSLSEKYEAYRDSTVQMDGNGIHAMVCENNRAVRMTQAQLEAHPRWRGFGSYAVKHPAIRGWLAVPLIGRSGKNIGLLQLSDKYEGDFTKQDEYVALELGHLASAAIENSRLLEEISRLNAGLEQKVAERTVALARQEALFRTLAEQAPQTMWTASPDGAATYFNRAWFELMGGELKDWTGSQWLAAVHLEDVADVKANWKASRANQSVDSGIRRLLAKDGRYHTMAYRAAPVFDGQGKVSFWVAIDTDITEIKAIEAALRLSNQELEAFSYSVSHDLRSPLNTVDGFSRLLAKQLAPQLAGEAGEKAKHYLTRIQAGVAQMGELIEDLLSLSQVTRAQLHTGPVDLSAMARSLLDEWQAGQPERQVTVHIESGLQAQADGRLVSIAMENLLANAWKFTSHLTWAEISVGKKMDAAGLPVFFVKDNGAGFDMAYSDKLFEPFQRLHAVAEFSGTGIGLATVSRVIKRHGGRIWAESAPACGAAFFFTLPG